jgi:hypothetical protein
MIHGVFDSLYQICHILQLSNNCILLFKKHFHTKIRKSIFLLLSAEPPAENARIEFHNRMRKIYKLSTSILWTTMAVAAPPPLQIAAQPYSPTLS